MKISNAAATAGVEAITDLLDGGTLRILTGSAPTNVDDAETGTLLAELTFGSPAFGAGSNGVVTANAITQDSSANNTGTAGYARGLSSGSAAVAQFTVGTSGSDINLVTLSIVSGQPVQITSFTITQPKG